MKLYLCLALAFLGCLEAKPKSYDGYVVLETEVLSKEVAQTLFDLQSTVTPFYFWKDPYPGRRSQIMASPDDLKELQEYLTSLDIDYATHIEDVEELLRDNEKQKGEKIARDARYNLDWDDYYSHDDINEFMDELAATYSFVDSFSMGTTFEGRDQRAISMTRAGPGKPNFWIEAGVHAREWIAPAVATFLIRELVENDAAHPQYLDNLNIYVMPVGNPDGYEYTRDTADGDRLWRKTRSFYDGNVCFGVDPNRNFEFHWSDSGSTNVSCTETYYGPAPFSEKETSNVRDFYLGLDAIPVVSHSIHSAAELWLYPFGYAPNTFPSNVDELIDVANQCVAALEAVHGIPFKVECLSDLYVHSGTSPDWYKNLGSQFVYTTELRDQGFGFVLPPDQIIPSGEEMWAAEQVLLDKAIEVGKRMNKE